MNYSLECASLEAVSKLRITGNKAGQAPEARKTIARGERSEPLVMEANRRSPGGAKDIEKEAFRPFRALQNANSYQGFAALTPGYYLAPPPGAWKRLGHSISSFETAFSAPTTIGIKKNLRWIGRPISL
jgi:hypothetical protein